MDIYDGPIKQLFLSIGSSDYWDYPMEETSMSRPAQGRDALLAGLDDAMRDAAGRTVLIHQAVAHRFGLNPTDLKCLDLARHEERLTAGRLAEATGMSTSAITAVLDRMERAGFIERRRDAHDRRKVFVVSTGRREAETARAFAPLQDAVHGALAG
jgi:DNA-binding MarR family transcriptional regulator